MMANDDQKETKLAPIFESKTNKLNDKLKDIDGNNHRKRKKKSNKSEIKNKTIKKFGTNCLEKDLNEPIVYRRSSRLRSKSTDNEIKYNEDSAEEEVTEQRLPNNETDKKVSESVVLLTEDSNTVGYWTDHKSDHCLTIDSTDEDIEILSSNEEKVCSKNCSEESQQAITCGSEEPKEYLLWTEKYKPMNGSEMVGHSVAMNRLKSWLEDWGKSDCKRQLIYEDDSENSLDQTNSCLLICGPTGSGKTSMVYAIAEQLKYEVLELNASMKRNGRVISKILGEATQSHQMQRNIESNGTTPSIHTFFTSMANNHINRVDNDLKIVKIVGNNRKPKPKGILSYFSKQTQNSSKSIEIEIIDNKCEEKPEKQFKSYPMFTSSDKSSNECPLFAPKALSIATNSLILFDDIDVMIDEDLNGFWSAFNRINETTKKPVILTATQFVPYIESCINGLQVLTLNKPNSSQTIECLKSICDKELDDYESDVKQNICKYLSDTYDNDIRRCINELQFGTVGTVRQNIKQKDSQTEQMSETKFDFNSYYDSILFEDIMQNSFGVFSCSQNRNNWMKCKPNVIENDSQTITLAKDIIETISQLNSNVNQKSVKLCPSKELSKPIDSESIECISRYLSPNINLTTILLDYCPHLSLICESEFIRQSQLANHSRRSRRFMHHLDSIGFFIDNVVKTKLISSFIPKERLNISEKISEESVSGHQIDDYFYD